MTPEDLAYLQTPEDPCLNVSADRVAVVVASIDVEADLTRRSVWIGDLSPSGDPSEALVEVPGGGDDTMPRWSPSGDRLAFLRREEPSARAVLVAGGVGRLEAGVVSRLLDGVAAFSWAPDGRSLAVVEVERTRPPDDGASMRRTRRLTSFPYRYDDVGWLGDERWFLSVLAGGAVRRLVEIRPGESGRPRFSWRPDGRAIAYLSEGAPRRRPEPGLDVHEVDVGTGASRQVVERGGWSAVSYRSDGALHLLGYPDPWGHPTNSGLWRVEHDLTDLTGHLDRRVLPAGDGPEGLAWLGDRAVVLVEDRGRVGVAAAAPDGTVHRLIEGDRVVLAADASAGAVVFVESTPTNPGEAMLWVGGEERTVTGLQEDFARRVRLRRPITLTATAPGGPAIDGWIYLPDGADTDAGAPLLLVIHGGPAAQYGWGFLDEFQVYAAAGFAVVACNPRGSSGRGRAFLRAVTGDGWGVVDRADVEAMAEAAADLPGVDGTRRGVMGGSYGGFLTAWLLACDPTYRAAVVERALLDWPSFSGTSDIGWYFPINYLGEEGRPPTGDRMQRASPLAGADRIVTPTLLIHSEDDHRCPISQAEQLFAALALRNVEVEMLRFPGEGHELSRSGTPRHRIERFHAILEWHGRHLAGPKPDVAD